MAVTAELKGKSAIPHTSVMELTTTAAGQTFTAAAIGNSFTAIWAAGPPWGRSQRNGEAMAQADLKILLHPIDKGHAGLKLGAMHLL
jgi:hypothetical protein